MTRPLGMNWRVEQLFPRWAVLLVSLFISVAHAYAQTQAAMNAQARAEFERADAELNKTYHAVLAKLRDTESKQKLKETQRAWITSRDTAAAHAADEAGGGSMAPAIRYETMAGLTQQRIKLLKTRLAGHAAPDEKDAGTPSPKPTATSSVSAHESNKEPAAAAPNPSSVSPDKKWEYLGGKEPRILEAGTNQVVIALEENEVSLSDRQMEICNCEVFFEGRDMVVWAPDSKRFGFNYDFHTRVYDTAGNVIETPVRRGYTFESVAFYELRGDKWVALQSPAGDLSKGSQLVQSLKAHLPKKFNPRDCAPDRDVLKLHRWTDTSTAILYAPCYGRKSDNVKAAFLFTLKFDAAGKWKIIKTHQMSEKEVEKIEKGE